MKRISYLRLASILYYCMLSCREAACSCASYQYYKNGYCQSCNSCDCSTESTDPCDDTCCPTASFNFDGTTWAIYLSSIFGTLFIALLIYCIWKKCRQQNIEVPPPMAPSLQVADSSLIRIELSDKSAADWKKIEKQSIKIQEDCPICQSSQGNSLTQCQHSFHPKCIYDWLKKNHTCPLCRKFILGEITAVCVNCKQYAFKKNLVNVVAMPKRKVQVCPNCQRLEIFN